MTFNYLLVNQFLDTIFPLPEEFGLIFDDGYGHSELPDYEQLLIKLRSVDPDVSVECGMSKFVILSPNLKGIVIKIPFNGCYIEDEEDGSLKWEFFESAPSEDFSDYCLAEFEKYKNLKANKLNCFVAKTYFYKTISGIRVFIQEEATAKNNTLNIPQASKASFELAKSLNKGSSCCINAEWLANCLDKYGKSKVKRFLNYCESVDFDIIADLHSGNLGYRFNNTPVILDYSNFLN